MSGRPKKRGKRFHGKPCHRGHTERYISNGNCCQCDYERATRRNASPKFKAYIRDYQQRQRLAAKLTANPLSQTLAGFGISDAASREWSPKETTAFLFSTVDTRNAN